MIEFVKHLFGFCGDVWHLNIFHIIMGTPVITYAMLRVKNKTKGLINQNE